MRLHYYFNTALYFAFVKDSIYYSWPVFLLKT